MSKRDEYVARMKQQLDELNAQMDALDAKAKEAKGEVQARYKSEMEKLRKQYDAALSKLDEIKAAGEDSWEKMVAEMDNLRDAFKHSYNYFKSQI